MSNTAMTTTSSAFEETEWTEITLPEWESNSIKDYKIVSVIHCETYKEAEERFESFKHMMDHNQELLLMGDNTIVMIQYHFR